MLDLFTFEFKRYQKYALLLLTALLAIFAYAYSIAPLSILRGEPSARITLFTVVISLIFGIYQMAVHGKKSNWTYLIHRPIAPKNIYHSLVGAGLLLLVLVTFLPLFITFNVINIAGTETIELRHFLYCLHLLFIALAAYLVGTYIVLNASWGAILSLVVLSYMITNTPVEPTLMFATDILCILALYYLSYRSFKVNLSTHFTKKRELVLASLLMQPVLAILILMTQGLYYHIPLIIIDAHPDAYSYEEGKYDNYYSALWHWDNVRTVEKIVDETKYPDKTTLMKQVEIAPEFTIDTRPIAFQHFNQLPQHDKTSVMVDKTNQVNWVFSHRERVFIGRDIYTKVITGYLAQDGFYASISELNTAKNARFTQVPRIIDNKFIQTQKKIYSVDFQGRFVELKNELTTDNEYFITELQLAPDSNTAIILTNNSIQFFDIRLLNEESSYTEPDLVVPNYRDIFIKRRIAILQLVDGYLIHFYSSSFFDFGQPGTSLVYAKFDGSINVLGEYSFSSYRPLPNLLKNQNYWQSPVVMNILFDTITSLQDPSTPNAYTTVFNFTDHKYPAISNIYAIIAALFSALITYLLAKRIALPTSRIWFWTILNLFFSLPGVLSFILLNRWREHLFIKKRTTTKSNAKPELSIA